MFNVEWHKTFFKYFKCVVKLYGFFIAAVEMQIRLSLIDNVCFFLIFLTYDLISDMFTFTDDKCPSNVTHIYLFSNLSINDLSMKQ